MTTRDALLAVSASLLVSSSAWSQNVEMASTVVAEAVRDQGHECRDPHNATRDEAASEPDVTTWDLECQNAGYRVTFRGDDSTVVEPLSD